MSNAELATGYAALILADEGLEITADKLATLTKAAGIEVEPIWTQLFAKALEGKDVKDLLLNVGSMNLLFSLFASSGSLPRPMSCRSHRLLLCLLHCTTLHHFAPLCTGY